MAMKKVLDGYEGGVRFGCRHTLTNLRYEGRRQIASVQLYLARSDENGIIRIALTSCVI